MRKNTMTHQIGTKDKIYDLSDTIASVIERNKHTQISMVIEMENSDISYHHIIISSVHTMLETKLCLQML